MSDLFLKILNMSISASWLVLAVLLLRIIFKKAPKWVNVLLWGLVAVRLICPFSIESALSLIPSAETISPTIMTEQTPTIQTGVPAINHVINPVIGGSLSPAPGDSANPLQLWIPILSTIWVVGVIAFILYTSVTYWRLRRKVSEATILRENIFQSENVASPFVLGIIKPRVYLPYGMSEQDLGHVVAHEQAHIRRRDHWWKPLGFFLLTIHWFNPLMWVAYVLLCRDIELACDEKVIKELGNEQRADYTQALVVCSVNRHMIAACPLAFGEVGVKERVKSVMNYKKPAFWVIVVAVIACVVVAVCFLTNPVNPQDSLELIARDTPAGANEVVYSANLGNQVHGGLIYAEQWSNGECVRSSPVMLTQNVEKIGVRTDVRKEASVSVGVDVQIDTYGRGGSLITYFAFPEADAFLGWAFTTRELNESVTVTAQEDIILAAMAFDSGNGVRAFDCQTLENEPERLKDADYMIVIRACFNNNALQFNQTYGVVEVIYETPVIGYSMVAQVNTPEYMVDESNHFYSIKEHSDVLNWTDLGELSEITLTRGDFDKIFRRSSGAGWLTDQSAAQVRRNTIKAWRVVYNQDQLYYILQQNSGELYLARGYYDYSEKNDPYSDDTSIHWLYRIAAIEKQESPAQEDTAITNIVDPTKDTNFSYDTAMEKFFEDENNDYFFGGIYSKYVIVHYTDGTSEDIIAALNSGRATLADLDRFSIPYWAEPKPVDLSSAIISAILDHYKPSDPDGLYHCAGFVLLDQMELCFDSDPPVPNQVIVYGMALHEQFSFAGGTIREVGNQYAVPVKLTFERTENGGVKLLDAWFPEQPYNSWDEYSEAVYEQFVTHSDDLATSVLYAIQDDLYLVQLKQECYRQAVAYIGIDTTPILEQLFSVIESSPLYSSNPGSYIDAHPDEYQELLYYGDITLQYIFSKFLEGDQIGLHGHIMRALLDDLAPEAQLRLYAMTGQEYFDEWKEAAIRVSEQHTMEWIKENQPAIWTLLQMMADDDAVEMPTGNSLTDVATPKLTIRTLRSLVDRYGEDLTWDTFDTYYSEEIISDLYALRYPIDADYYLLIIGNTEKSPVSIRLVSAHDPDSFIDIRTDSIDAFINATN